MKPYLFNKARANQDYLLGAYLEHFNKRGIDLNNPVCITNDGRVSHLIYNGSGHTQINMKYFDLVVEDLDNLEKWL